MKYRITEIDLDFDDSIGELPDLEKQDVIDEVLATTWEADDADDLVEEITLLQVGVSKRLIIATFFHDIITCVVRRRDDDNDA